MTKLKTSGGFPLMKLATHASEAEEAPPMAPPGILDRDLMDQLENISRSSQDARRTDRFLLTAYGIATALFIAAVVIGWRLIHH